MPASSQTGSADALLGMIGDGGEMVVFDQVGSEPTTDVVEDALAAFRAGNCDGIVAVGGGSVVDTGKAVSVLCTNEGPLTRFEGLRPHRPTRSAPDRRPHNCRNWQRGHEGDSRNRRHPKGQDDDRR